MGNSWEEGEDEVVVDLATNPWDAMLKYADIETILHHEETDKETADQVMKRVRLNLKSRTMEVEDWPNDSGIPMMNTMDFPVINENYLGYKNRYVYGWVGIDYWRMTLSKRIWRIRAMLKHGPRPAITPERCSSSPTLRVLRRMMVCLSLWCLMEQEKNHIF